VQEDALNCTCTWTKDPETEIPFLCVAGRDGKIKVYDVIHGKLVRVCLLIHDGRIVTVTNGFFRCLSDTEGYVPASYHQSGYPGGRFGRGAIADAQVQEINDLSTCPTNFLLIASASDDTTVRIWSLDPADKDQTCVCLLAGEGHSSGLLTVVRTAAKRCIHHDTKLDLRLFTIMVDMCFRRVMTTLSAW